jgi:hypothetical protein
MKVVKDSYISINFYFVMTQTPIKYFKGELMYFRRESTVPYILDICG